MTELLYFSASILCLSLAAYLGFRSFREYEEFKLFVRKEEEDDGAVEDLLNAPPPPHFDPITGWEEAR